MRMVILLVLELHLLDYEIPDLHPLLPAEPGSSTRELSRFRDTAYSAFFLRK